MTLQRGMEGGLDTWLRSKLLPSLAELNGQFIDLLILQAVAHPTAGDHPLPAELLPLLLDLDPGARRRVAACPYLLMDAGFADPQRWLWAHGYAVRDAQPMLRAPIAGVPQGVALARHVFAFAWHLASAHRNTASMLLGMSATTAQILSGYTVVQTVSLAETYPHWLQPRWPRHVRMWSELLKAAVRGESASLERARLRGVQLMATERRSSA